MILSSQKATMNEINVLINFGRYSSELSLVVLVHGPPNHYGLEPIIYLDTVNDLENARK